MQYAPDIRIIRVMCSGRLDPAFVLRAFEKGADGVLITGCHVVDCHYLFGAQVMEDTYKTIERLVHMLGIDKERLRYEQVSAAEAARFVNIVNEFVDAVKTVGPRNSSPKKARTGAQKLAVTRMKADNRNLNSELADQIERSKALSCLKCGKCTSVCPLATIGRNYSHGVTITRAISHDFEGLLGEFDLWSCLTCKKCDTYCPAGVRYLDLIKALRTGARKSGIQGKCSHAGAVQSLARIMVEPAIKQRRLDWLPQYLKTARKGEILYYVGCAPYFDTLFTDLKPHTIDAAVNSIRILNILGIKPMLLSNERCCGHDLYWNGDQDNFMRLAEYNRDAIERSGAKTVLFSCAECLSAFKGLYPEHGVNVSAELKHMSEFLAEKVDTGELSLSMTDAVITYQDPCRLGRHLGIYDAPRSLLGANDNDHLKEMKQYGARSLCCGVSAWMNCDITSKAIQVERLKQARATGAKVLAVACPKCQIHLLCAQKDRKVMEETGIEIRDIATLTLERLKQPGGEKCQQDV